MPYRRPRPWLPALLLATALAASLPAETLWVEQASAPDFPELVLDLSPWNRSTLRLLREKKVRVQVDSQAATLLAVDEAPTPLHVYLLLDRAAVDAKRGEAMDLLARKFVQALPEGTAFHAWALTTAPEPVMTGTTDQRRLAAALTAGPRQGRHAALRRGLEVALAAMEERPAPRRVLVVLSVSRDPGLRAGQHTRREVLSRVRRLGLHPAAFSLGSGVDRSFLRALGEGSGGVTQHSWSPRNLRDGLGRVAVGLGLTRRVRVQSPFFEEDGSLRWLQVLRPDGRRLADSRIRYPGAPPTLPPPVLPTPTAAAPPPVAVPRPDVPRPPPPPAPRPAGPGAAFAAIPSPPRLELGRWPETGESRAERELAHLLDARLAVVASHADAGLHRALRGIELALENRDARLARRLYRHARLSMAFLGSTYARTLAGLEADIERQAEAGVVRPAFLEAQGEHLETVRARWDRFKEALLAWGDHLADLPATP